MEVRIETAREYTAHKRKKLGSSLDTGLVCSICKRPILVDEHYFKTGRDYAKEGFRAKGFHMRASTIKIYCNRCESKLYVDGDD